jgi:hypothetical protein
VPAYRFAIRKDAAKIEKLGVMGLPDDAAALVFGKQLIQDMVLYGKPGADYAGWTLEIVEGERTIGGFLFDAVKAEK